MLRRRSQLALIIWVVTVLVCFIPSVAQVKPSAEKAKPASKPKPTDLETVAVRIVNAEYAGKIVKGAPYSATAITESTQTLADGNQIIRKKELAYYRDSQGRMRIEQRLDTIGEWTAAKPGPIVMISDPVAGRSYNLDPRNRVAVKSSPYFKEVYDDVLNDVAPQETERQLKADFSGRIREESLPKKTFELVEAEGTRTTVTIPAGEIGNTLPIEVIDEKWYSPDLRAVVMTRHSDPRTGEVIWRLTDINRGEPDPSLFRVPVDYKTEEIYRVKYSTKPPQPPQRPRRKQAEQTRKLVP